MYAMEYLEIVGAAEYQVLQLGLKAETAKGGKKRASPEAGLFNLSPCEE